MVATVPHRWTLAEVRTALREAFAIPRDAAAANRAIVRYAETGAVDGDVLSRLCRHFGARFGQTVELSRRGDQPGIWDECEHLCRCIDGTCTACVLRRLTGDIDALLAAADDFCACEVGRTCTACRIVEVARPTYPRAQRGAA